MLRVEHLDVFHGDAQALDDGSIEIGEGTIVAIVGANGAGKTSLIRTIAGMYRPARGRIVFRDTDIGGWESHRVCNLGIGQVAEGRQVFPTLSVAENLDMGAMVPRARAGRAQNLERVLALFPVLAERAGQAAGTLSGGEQQMLAIGRCLMGAPELVMFDEPSLGLAPAVVQHVLRTIRDLNREGLTCVLVEQNVAVSLRLAAHAYVLENGRVTLSGSGEGLLADDRVRQAYLGILSASACDVVPMIRAAMLRARSVVGSAADPMTYPPRSRWLRQCLEWSRLVTGSLTTHSVPKFHRRANQASVSREWRLARYDRPMQGPRRRRGRRFKEVVMKLYFAPGACSLSPHIVMREAGAQYDLEQVNNQEKKTKSGTDYWTINAKGQVPVLEFDNGERLTEGPVIVQWIADQNPASGLVPPAGKLERYRVQEWLNFITSELHKTFGPIFRPTTPDAFKALSKENLGKRFDWLDKQLAGKDYLMGDKFTIADAYLFTVLRWTSRIDIDLAKWPNLKAYVDRVAARPKVQEALKAEGLVK